ncbi:MAG: zinc-binding dehydrogenase, partial [Chitinophagaceae bacterium]|nr:zinc-binding dehydrogenase [Anaerolineae bacterium]
IALGATSLNHDLHIGDHCCIRPYLNCGHCGACLRGYPNACMNMQVMGVHRDGGMREVINVPIDKVHSSSILNDESLALVETLSIGAHAVQRAQIIPGEFALVIGMGPIGLGVSKLAAMAGAQVIAMDVSDSRLAFIGGQLEIAHTIDGRQDVMEQLKAIIPHELPTVVFDATGNAQSMMKSFDYVAHGGRLVFVGLFQGEVRFFDPEFHRREMTLLASRNATLRDFQQVISALEQGQVDVSAWTTHRVTTDQIIGDFPKWIEPNSGVFKAMLSF